jgi:uncharacterized protein (DUF924 family)
MPSEEQKMESLQDLLARTITEGAPLYNAGDKEGCFHLYFDTAKYACMVEKIGKSAAGQLLEVAADEAMSLGEAGNFGEGAWVLRHTFDAILASEKSNRRQSLLLKTDIADDDSSDASYWQDEPSKNTTDPEKAQCLSDIYTILLSSIQPSKHTRFGVSSFDNCFPASIIVETLVTLGLSAHRKMAAMKANMLLDASFMKSVSHKGEASFTDGTHLYRFSTAEEIQNKWKELQDESPKEGSNAAIYLLALQDVVETPTEAKAQAKHAPLSLSVSESSAEHAEGTQLSKWAVTVEAVVDVDDRKHNFKTYPQCFIGADAITAVVHSLDLPPVTRTDAKLLLNRLLKVGLLRHVTHDHELEDKKLFYRFASAKEMQTHLDAYNALANTTSGPELVRYFALLERFKQFAGLDIAEILDSFYGATEELSGEACWDNTDLQTWRNNMKRWGFGRSADQDDAMVDKLSPLLAGLEPDTWEPPSEEWWSPWGILAQLAIFDQISRSAFRGTPEAFKWDKLAIKATKVAIERGYFDMAYKSTLNQFVILLPLEHSESWEDQKLGVSMLLRMLSTVAIQDEGFSDYEIVKRLEFSKRLATAFLEHAQVIAKFKQYPHRNKAHNRATSLEERIWLASDLVPRWAKSQQRPESGERSTPGRNLLKLPVIPLKRLTRGS